MDEQKKRSNQICVYKNQKTLLEFLDKLRPTTANHYAHIHACKEDSALSRIGVQIGSYAEKPAVYVQANLEAAEISYLFDCASAFQYGEFVSQEKIIAAAKDEEGRARVTKLRIGRLSADRNGTPRRCPWVVSIENGTGIPTTSATGGTMCQSGSYKLVNKASVYLSDIDMYKLLYACMSFIQAWETRTGVKLLAEKEKGIL